MQYYNFCFRTELCNYKYNHCKKSNSQQYHVFSEKVKTSVFKRQKDSTIYVNDADVLFICLGQTDILNEIIFTRHII